MRVSLLFCLRTHCHGKQPVEDEDVDECLECHEQQASFDMNKTQRMISSRNNPCVRVTERYKEIVSCCDKRSRDDHGAPRQEDTEEV